MIYAKQQLPDALRMTTDILGARWKNLFYYTRGTNSLKDVVAILLSRVDPGQEDPRKTERVRMNVALE